MSIMQHCKLWQSTNQLVQTSKNFRTSKSETPHSKSNNKIKFISNLKLINILMIYRSFCVSAYVVIGFFFSWAPFHAQRLVYIYMQDHPYYEEINTWIFIITGIFYYFSSTLNPILYNLMSVKMRNAFKEVILGKKPQRTFITTSQTTTVVRDTRSHRQSQKTDDTEQLVKKEMVNTPPSRDKKKIIYKRNKNIKNGDTRISLETSI